MSASGTVWLLLLVMLLAGCSSQDFTRPLGPLGNIMDSGKPYLESESEEEAARRAARFAEVLAAWEQKRSAADQEYHLGVDDVLELGVLALDQPGAVSVLRRTIGPDGRINLPLVGDMALAGLTPQQAEARVREAYGEKYLKNPTVTLKVAEYRSRPVVLTGAVKKPGVYYLQRNTSTILEVLGMADGLAANAGDTLIIVRGKTAGRAPGEATPSSTSNATDVAGFPDIGQPASPSGGQEMITVDLQQLLVSADMRFNVTVHGGDVISVPPAKRKFVYVLGYVRNPGALEVREGDRVEALQAVAMAGGLAPAGRAQNCRLISQRGGQRQIISVDLTKIVHGVRPPLYLEPGDTLIVGTSFLARLGEFVKPSVGAGATFSPVP